MTHRTATWSMKVFGIYLFVLSALLIVAPNHRVAVPLRPPSFPGTSAPDVQEASPGLHRAARPARRGDGRVRVRRRLLDPLRIAADLSIPGAAAAARDADRGGAGGRALA